MSFSHRLDGFFHITERGSTISTEIKGKHGHCAATAALQLRAGLQAWFEVLLLQPP
jgi:hypothetical protein